MCGIGGYLGAGNSEFLTSTARLLASSLSHRGPDASDIFVQPGDGSDGSVGLVLAHTRLSILDLSSNGAQPMVSADGRYTLSYNGELYNYRELRLLLQETGCRFVSESDTEVVLQALIVWGETALSRFNGMFALAMWDRQTSSLLLARDRWGIKPLYYVRGSNSFSFASEIQSLLAIGTVERKLAFQGFSEYLYYGNALGENTLYENCYQVKAGHALTIHRGGRPQHRAYWHASQVALNVDTQQLAVEKVRSLLERSVKRHLIADVPVGLFLSGGLDSSTLCALAAEQYHGRLATYSVAFEGSTAHSELDVAREVARRYDTDHNEMTITFGNLESVLEALTHAHGQPFGDAANVPLYLLTAQLPDNLKVVLQGDGGDEFFGGYKRYQLLKHARLCQAICRLPLMQNEYRWPASVLRRGHRMLKALGTRNVAERCARLLSEEQSDRGVIDLLSRDAREQLTTCDAFHRYKEVIAGFPRQVCDNPQQLMLWTDAHILLPDQFLEKVDRSTMANSVEVRVPFLDNELTDYMMGLPPDSKLAGPSKNLLRRAMADRLPDSVITGPKHGFGVPYAEWLRGPLASYTEEKLFSGNSLMQTLFDQTALRSLWVNFKAGKSDRGIMVYKLMMFSMWCESHDISV